MNAKYTPYIAGSKSVNSSNNSGNNISSSFLEEDDSLVDEVRTLEEVPEETFGVSMSQTLGNGQINSQPHEVMQITSNVGNSELANALIGSPRAINMHEQQQQQQQIVQGNQMQRQAAQLQAVVTPQGLQNRKTVSVAQPVQHVQVRQQPVTVKTNSVNSTMAGQVRQISVQQGAVGNQPTYATQQIVVSPQQRQLLLQKGQKAINSQSENKIMEILASVQQSAPSASAAVNSSNNVQIQAVPVSSQAGSSQITSVLKNIIASPGSTADIKNASSGGKVQYRLNLANQGVVRPNNNQVIRQKILQHQQQQGASTQVMQVNASGQQQSVVLQGQQQQQMPQRQILVQQGNNVVVQQQQISQQQQQQARTQQFVQQGRVTQQAQSVPQGQSIQQGRNQQFLSYQQHQQQQQLAQQRMQAAQQGQRQVQGQQQQQMILQQQQQVGSNQQQVQFQNQQVQHRTVQGNSSTIQAVNNQGQVYQVASGGKQILVRQQSPQTANLVRSVNQPIQSSQQIVYRDGNQQLVRVIPQGQAIQQGQLTTNQAGQVVQNGPVVKYLASTSNAMTTSPYQQNAQGPTTVFTAAGQKQHQYVQGGVQQQPSVVTLATQAGAQQMQSQTGYQQGTNTVVNTQSNSGINVSGHQVSYQVGGRPGLAQLKAAYGSPQAQYLQVAQSTGQAQIQQGVVPTMASTVVRQLKDAISTSTTARPQVHTVLASPDDDSPPTTPMRPGQNQVQLVNSLHQQQQTTPVSQPQQQGQRPSAVVTLLTGEDVTHRLKTLPAGTPVQVRRTDNVGLQAIWNGKSIALKDQMPPAPLHKGGENTLEQNVPTAAQIQQQVLVVPQGSGAQQYVMFTNNQGSMQTVVGGGGGSNVNHPITGTESLARRPLHPEAKQGQQQQTGPAEIPKPAPRKRPHKPFEEGKYALCANCGMQSADYNQCEGCNKEMPDEPRYYYGKTYVAAKKTKLDTSEEGDEKGGKDGAANSKGQVIDKKLFFGSKNVSDMQLLITAGGGKQIRKIATRSPLLPRVLAKSQAKKAKPMKKNSEPEVVSILSSDEEDTGNGEGTAPNVNPSPSSSRSNTPTPKPGSAKTRRIHRMEDKVKKTEDIQMPEFLEPGTNTNAIDKDAKSRWLWSWMKVEILIEFSGGLHRHVIGDVIRKTPKMGEAYCILCRKFLNYHQRGRTTILDHCRRQDHMGQVLLQWQESGMEADETAALSDNGVSSSTDSSYRKDGKAVAPPTKRGKAPMSFTVKYEGSIGGSEMNLDVRSVRIGSMKAKPFDNCLVNKEGFTFKIQCDTFIEIKLGANDVEQLIGHLGEEIPVLFIYTTPGCAARIRSQLNMKSDGGPYFDPGSKVEAQKRLVLQMHPPSEEQLLERQFQNICKSMQQEGSFPGERKQFLTLIDKESAEKMLDSLTGPEEGEPSHPIKYMFTQEDGTQIEVPVESRQDGHLTILVNGTRIVLPEYRIVTRGARNSDDEDDEPMDRSRSPSPPHAVFNGPIIRLFIYPPPPRTGGIQVSNEDLFCLNEGEFLNDVIIDFYLKYLYIDVLSEEDRERTHIFSSFFYRRLTQRSKRNEDQNLTPQQRRHSRVKTWTRHVDLFKKDFIVVPINESAHWYLAIICFAGLEKPEPWTSAPPKQQIMLPEKPEDSGESAAETAPAEEGAAVKPEDNQETEGASDSAQDTADESGANATSSQDNVAKAEKEVLDELTKEAQEEEKAKSPQEGEDENMEGGETAESETPSAPDVPAGCFGFKKRPCILVFDSLAGPSRNAVIRTLREYLQVEWDSKKSATEGERVFDKDFIKGANPKCPQQTNFSDCGVYVLQYVESFYKMPISNYTIPMRCLEQWFPDEHVLAKRERLRELILSLQKQLNPTLEYDPSQDTYS